MIRQQEYGIFELVAGYSSTSLTTRLGDGGSSADHGMAHIGSQRFPTQESFASRCIFQKKGSYTYTNPEFALAFPAGYYWYGGKRKGPGRPPKWVDRLLQSGLRSAQGSQQNDNDPTPRSPGSEDALPTVMDDADSLSEAQDTEQQSHSNPETPPMDPSPEDGVVCGGDDWFRDGLPEECAQHSSGTSSAPPFRESSATPKQPSPDPPAEDSVVKTTPEAVKEPDRESESRVHGRPRRRIKPPERLM